MRFLSPEPDHDVSGLVRIRVDVSAAQPITQVAIHRDGQVLDVDFDRPVEVMWDTRRETDGSHTLTATAVDADFREGTAPPLTVVVDNTPPTVELVGLRDGTAVFGLCRLEAKASDARGVAAVRFLKDGELLAEVTTPPYIFQWNTEAIPNIRYTLKARAIDRADNATNSAPVAVKVSNGNRYPVLDPLDPQVVEEGKALTFTVHAVDPNGERDPLTYHASDLPSWATFDEKTGAFHGTPGFGEALTDQSPRMYVTHIAACDPEQQCAGKEVTITVANKSRPPQLQPIADQAVAQGRPLKVGLAVTDPDDDPTTCKVENKPSWLVLDEANCVLTGTPPEGTVTREEPERVYEDVAVSVCDAELCTTQKFSIKVSEFYNHPPVLSLIGPQRVDEEDRLQITITATDPDGDTLKVGSGQLPDGATITPDKQEGAWVFRWRPRADQSGVYPVVVAVTDETATANQTLVITVRERSRAISGTILSPNQIPVPGATVEIGTPKETFRKVTTDAKGFFIATNLPAGEYTIRPDYQVKHDAFSSDAVTGTGVAFAPIQQRVTLAQGDVTGVNFMAVLPASLTIGARRGSEE